VVIRRSSENIKLRRALALALGWYLMVPPINRAPAGYEAQFGLPLSKWTVNTAFDSAYDCEAMHTPYLLKNAKNMNSRQKGSLSWALAVAATQSQCIASDDPRLKASQ
jgi:hypothetical protein